MSRQSVSWSPDVFVSQWPRALDEEGERGRGRNTEGERGSRGEGETRGHRHGQPYDNPTFRYPDMKSTQSRQGAKTQRGKDVRNPRTQNQRKPPNQPSAFLPPSSTSWKMRRHLEAGILGDWDTDGPLIPPSPPLPLCVCS